MDDFSKIRDFFRRGRPRGKGESELDRKTYEALESDQQEMIQSVVEFGDTTVKEVMVPRIDTIFLQAAVDEEELLRTIVESGHSRFPVYHETIDNVVGILYSKDLLSALVRRGRPADPEAAIAIAGDDADSGRDANGRIDIVKLLRKPYFVPETKHIDELLRELRRRRVHIAVVVDEYGGTSGIVCMEDIIEEIIGDIQDEFDNERDDITPLAEGVWLCDVRCNLEDLFEELAIPLPAGDFDTLGGFVFDLFGKIPVKYEKVSYAGHDFIIQEMEGRRSNTVKIVKVDKDAE
jgi:CBS domain containing-hemolysin-like protein